jgi:RecA/RadA recombinase
MAKEKKTGFSKVLKVFNDDPEIRAGFSDINMWTDTGIPALNYYLSSSYDRAFIYGSMAAIYGESGSGKSLLLAQMAGIEQKMHNAYVVWVDVEGAESDRTEGLKWFQQAGVDTDEENFLRVYLPTFRKALKLMTTYVNLYREETEAERPLIIIFDSYSALQTDTMMEQNKGKKDLTGDQGQKAKQLGDFVRRVKGMIEGLRILVVGVNHVYMSQEEYGPKHKITGGLIPMFMAHCAVKMSKADLTNKNASPHLRQSPDADDEKNIIGIRTLVEVMKTRSFKPGEKLNLEVVYPVGIDRNSGLWDLFLDKGIIISPTSGWYEFTRSDGSKQKFRRKNFLEYVDELMKIPLPMLQIKDLNEADTPQVDDITEEVE